MEALESCSDAELTSAVTELKLAVAETFDHNAFYDAQRRAECARFNFSR